MIADGLTNGDRVRITALVAAIIVLPAAAGNLLSYFIYDPQAPFAMAFSMAAPKLAAALPLHIPLPFALGLMVRLAKRDNPRLTIASIFLAVIGGAVSGGVAVITLLAIRPLLVWSPPIGWWTYLSYSAIGILMYTIAMGIVRAVLWYRVARAEDERRRVLESDAVRRARSILERRFRPATMTRTLRRVAAEVLVAPRVAELRLRRLACHARLLLNRPSEQEVSLHDELSVLRSAVSLEREEICIKIEGQDAYASSGPTQALVAALEKSILEARPDQVTITTSNDKDKIVVSVTASRAREEILNTVAFLPQREPAPPMQSEPLREERHTWPVVPIVTIPVFAAMTWTIIFKWSVAAFALGVSFALWVFVGPILFRVVGRLVSFRFVKSALAALSVTFLAVLAISAVSVLCANILGKFSFVHEILNHALAFVVERNAAVACTIAATSFAQSFGRVWLEAQSLRMRAHDQAIGAEAMELEERFHPHFLFNALTSILALCRRDPYRAASMSRCLADLTTATVNSAGVAYWPLRSELRVVDDYLTIQRMRFGTRMALREWTFRRGTGALLVPRLILQPLLENAVKHAVSKTSDPTGIGLKARRRGRWLELETWNESVACCVPQRLGHGLEFVVARVRSAGGFVRFNVDHGRFVVTCRLPVTLH